MATNPTIYREYDIRGIAGVDFDEAFVEALGRALGTKLRSQRIGRIAVSRDCRTTSPAYHKVIKAALRSTGVDVIDIGQCPTPLLYFAVHHLDLLAGVQITGSHNPADYNGFKICIGKTTIYGEQIQELRRIVDKGVFERGDGREEAYPIIPAYQGFLEEQFARTGDGIRVVVDSGNGTGGPVGPAIYRAMGCEVVELYSEPDGRFPNHHPDPTVEANMADLIGAVRKTGAHLGIAYDGDADRIGAVDENGRIIWGDEMMVAFSRSILRDHPGATIVSEVKCSQRLYDDIERHGGNAIMWKVGHSLLKAKMKETGALLAGEMSGHVFFADRYFGYDDAVYAGARLIEILAKSGKKLSSMLADLPGTVFTPELRVDCPDEIKFQLADQARDRFRDLGYDLIDVDGVRIRFDKGWGLIRASNTQPALVMRFEASDQGVLDQYRRIVEGELDSLKARLTKAA